MRVLRDKVRVATSRSKTERPVSAVVADLNPVLRGWAAYFRNGNSGRKFNAVDGYVHERLAIFASRKHRLRGRNWTTRFTYGWITRLEGLPPDRKRAQGDGACQSVNDVGKPCAGEPHARLKRRGLETERKPPRQSPTLLMGCAPSNSGRAALHWPKWPAAQYWEQFEEVEFGGFRQSVVAEGAPAQRSDIAISSATS